MQSSFFSAFRAHICILCCSISQLIISPFLSYRNVGSRGLMLRDLVSSTTILEPFPRRFEIYRFTCHRVLTPLNFKYSNKEYICKSAELHMPQKYISLIVWISGASFYRLSPRSIVPLPPDGGLILPPSDEGAVRSPPRGTGLIRWPPREAGATVSPPGILCMRGPLKIVLSLLGTPVCIKSLGRETPMPPNVLPLNLSFGSIRKTRCDLESLK